MYYQDKLKATFKVLRVNYEPHCESTWWLEYKGLGPIICDEIFDETLLKDEDLVGGEIEAQIRVPSCKILPTIVKEKSMSFEGGFITATGIYEDDLLYKIGDEECCEYIIDSQFKIRIDLWDEPMPIKKGEWITVEGGALLILPRGVNLK